MCHRYIWLVALVVWFWSAPLPAVAETWEWQTTLQGDIAGIYLSMPTALLVDEKSERYYVVDSGNNRLVSFDRTGRLLNAFTANKQLRNPFDLARDDRGRLYVVEKGRNSVTRIDLKNKEIVPQTLKDRGRVVYVDRLEREGDDFYILDKASGSVLVTDSKFTVRQRLACTDCSAGFVDFRVRDGRIWALSQAENAVYRFRKDGTLENRISLGKALDFPRSLAVDPAGRLFVLDRHAGEIIAFARDGRFLYRFLGPGQARGQLYFPIELRFDPWGNICVVEEGNARVQIFGRK
ncbi:MAG: hypothetical protein L3J03_11725 [Desulfobacterales bacterium]|nr:hypothetical protein [Desulfobacterales bacterium]